MEPLYQLLAANVREWRDSGYRCDDYPAIAEILSFQTDPELGALRFLRAPQLRALETYWYLRLVERTPHVLDLYRRLYPRQSELLAALGLDHPDIRALVLDDGIDALWERITSDDELVRAYNLQALRETLALDYPSYILALAMGAGKTALIGTIVATEFAMALDSPSGPFVQNALVFAPGKTILESLRELAALKYELLLPPRLFKPFAASVKLTFTQDGDKDLPVIRGSAFNVVVTNTEKIRIQKRPNRTTSGWTQLSMAQAEDRRVEEANLRLQTIASLPNLAVFSDEAHHTYGQALDDELKKVRRTVNYLQETSPNLICVVNTTGTPYFRRQPLKDVVIWYGLSEGISDGILKEVAGNIHAYSFDPADSDAFLSEVIGDFFRDYGDTRLPNGALAKLAIYFPQTDHLEAARPVVESALVAAGESAAVVLRNTSDSSADEIDAFNRLNDPGSPHRVILLVNKGTEGWNCPSLYACALARKLKSSNNFVLQAATRCLRQVAGMNLPARIYLSMENVAILDRQLQETYGETIQHLNGTARDTTTALLKLRRPDLPPLSVTRTVRTVTRNDGATLRPLVLELPAVDGQALLTKASFTLAGQHATEGVLRQLGDALSIDVAERDVDLVRAAVDLATTYRLDLQALRAELRRIYGAATDIPIAHLHDLAEQIERQTRQYEVREEQVEVALALVKPDGFATQRDGDGAESYVAQISYPRDREHLLTRVEDLGNSGEELSFHYTPYNFDSGPEKAFLAEMLRHLQVHPDHIEGIYFTGALSDPSTTDFFVEYQDENGAWRRHTPDFVIRKKQGYRPECLIVEIKDARWEPVVRNELARGAAVSREGRKALAVSRWSQLNPETFKYQIVFADGALPRDQLAAVKAFIEDFNSDGNPRSRHIRDHHRRRT